MAISLVRRGSTTRLPRRSAPRNDGIGRGDNTDELSSSILHPSSFILHPSAFHPPPSTSLNRVLLYDPSIDKWLRFDQPVGVVCATQSADVSDALDRIEVHVETTGGWAAGFLSFEASPAFDAAAVVRDGSPVPLVWFGLFDGPTILDELSDRPETFAIGEWSPAISKADYVRAITTIKAHIRAGDTYQVNFTFPLVADFQGEPEALFHSLLAAQPAGYAALIETPTFAACSVSPELFFELDGRRLVSRPMKGTRRRGLNAAEDIRQREALFKSEKDRAENLMIVDMVRNDIGRVAEPGTVKVLDLFTVEQYPTVLQMTSTAMAETSASWSEIVAALFPCASITGAPKIRTMEIIAELEAYPRGLYTGAIGFVAPHRQSRFSVAIRTVQLDLERGEARYGVGGGIVWDSDAEDEYDECRTKAAILPARDPEFALLETMRYEPGLGVLFLERHLSRLRDSAAYFAFGLELDELRRTLAEFASLETCRLRLLLNRRGSFTVEHTPMRGADDLPVRLALARRAVDPSNRFLHHKTTNRLVYDTMRAGIENDVDDVVLHTRDGLVTETCRANLAVRVDGQLVTPALGVGLLPGVFRADCLDRGFIEETTVTIADLQSADELFVMSALRGMRRAILM